MRLRPEIVFFSSYKGGLKELSMSIVNTSHFFVSRLSCLGTVTFLVVLPADMTNSSLELPHQFRRHNSSESAISTPLFISSIACIVLNAPAAVFASIGNVLILAALRKTSSLHVASKALLGNLGVTDLCVGLVLQPLFVAMLLSDIQGTHKVPRFVLNSVSFPLSAVSLLTMTVISVDRLLALYLWRTYREVVTLQRVLITLAVSWLLGAVGRVIALLASVILYIAFSSASIVFCLSVSSLSFLFIYRKLRRLQFQVNGKEVRRGERNRLNVEKYRKSASVMLYVCCAIWLCYLPFVLYMVVMGRIGHTPATLAARDLCLSLIMLNSSLNPVLYCWRISEVRRATVNILQVLRCVPRGNSRAIQGGQHGRRVEEAAQLPKF